MDAYELMIKTNQHLINGGKLSGEQSRMTANMLLSARNISAVDHSTVSDKSRRRFYPLFYIPPYNNGRKLKTLLGQTPKTQIFSANMYELEILRLLCILAPDSSEVKYMIDETVRRLKTTCFGFMDDGVGECFDTSLVVLRFIAAAAQDETEWIKDRMDNYIRHCGDKIRSWYSLWYYWLCLSELPDDIAVPEIKRYREEMWLWHTNKKDTHPVRPYILKNILARYSECF